MTTPTSSSSSTVTHKNKIRRFYARMCVCAAGNVEDGCGRVHGASRWTVDDRPRHSLDIELHLAAGLHTAPEPQQLGSGRRVPDDGDEVSSMAHPTKRALRSHATPAAARDARAARERHRRTQDWRGGLHHVTFTTRCAERKTSLTRKVSQYFKSLYSNDYEVDLV